MAFRILPDGTIEADSLGEALQARDAILQKRPSRSRQKASGGSNISENTRAFLTVLWGKPQGVLSPEVAAALNLSPKSLPPIVRGLRTIAAKSKMDFADLLVVETVTEKGKQVTRYRLGEAGRRIFAGVIEHNDNGINRVPKTE